MAGNNKVPVAEYIIPKCEGRTFEVRAGQVLRLIELEGPQAADLVILNSENLKEAASMWLTRQVSGSFTRLTEIYSKLPWGNVMFELLAPLDVPGIFWLSGGRCNRMYYERRFGVKGHHGSCQEILATCLRPHGLSEEEMPDVFNVFMNASFTADGRVEFKEAPVRAGDYVDLRARMGCLVALSACPDELGAYNGGTPKPLKVEIFEGGE